MHVAISLNFINSTIHKNGRNGMKEDPGNYEHRLHRLHTT